jgi:DNA-binding MarR family transcriptional regulator
MTELELLQELFDEKIVKILSIFAKDPDRKFYLTEVTKITNVNVSTTFRILNSLVKKEFVRSVIIGRTRFYHLNNNDKTQKIISLLKFEKKETNDLIDFVERMKTISRIKKIILQSKEKNSAKVILIGDYIPMDRVLRCAQDVKAKNGYDIQYVELTQRQFDGLYNINEFKKNGKVLYDGHE